MMKIILTRRWFLGALAGLTLLPQVASASASKLTPTSPKTPVPALAFIDETGVVKSLSDYAGRPILLNLWATWCAPCVEEMPALMRLQQAWPELAVLPVAFDLGGVKAVRRFYDENGISQLPVLIDHERVTRKALKPKGLPLTLVINSKGEEVGRALGKVEWDEEVVIARLRALL
jgi:thiol-disulfide isomerase/thioredoxin